MKALLAFITAHGTKLIGAAQGTVAALAGVAGLIPEAHLKYWLAASAILTFWRGFVNGLTLANARAEDTGGESQ